MAFYKAICAKNGQKVEMIVQFNSTYEAQEDLHKQGYSIIEIQEVSEYKGDSDVFYFDILADGKVKSGQINSKDPIKAYIKLVDDLHYNVLFIYDKKDCDEKRKTLITEKIKYSYEIYKKQNSRGNDEKKKEEKRKEEEEKRKIDNKIDIPEFLKKELDYYYDLVDKVLEKIDSIFNNYKEFLTPEKSLKLKELSNALKQVKNITNTTKLKLIGELALVKIGEFQVELISKGTQGDKKDILKETNKLLKSFGSGKQVIMPEDDIKLKVNILLKDFSNFINNIFHKDNGDKIDRNSGKYFDILREIDIYKKKLKDAKKEYIKTIFNKEKNLRIKLKIKLLKQNIRLIENRIRNTQISYSKTIKGFSYYNDAIFYLLSKLGDVFVYSVLFYSLFFIFYNLYSKIFKAQLDFNYNFLITIILLSFFGFTLKTSKNFISLVLFSFFYILLLIFLVVNF